MQLRLGQRVTRVVWHGMKPGVQVGKVTRVTPRTCDIDGERANAADWCDTHLGAIGWEMNRLFGGFFHTNSTMTRNERIERLAALLRLQRKVRKYFRRKRSKSGSND